MTTRIGRLNWHRLCPQLVLSSEHHNANILNQYRLTLRLCVYKYTQLIKTIPSYVVIRFLNKPQKPCARFQEHFSLGPLNYPICASSRNYVEVILVSTA